MAIDLATPNESAIKVKNLHLPYSYRIKPRLECQASVPRGGSTAISVELRPLPEATTKNGVTLLSPTTLFTVRAPSAIVPWMLHFSPVPNRLACSSKAALSDRHLTSGDAVNFSSDVAGLITCEQNEDRGNLRRLGGAPEDGQVMRFSLARRIKHDFDTPIFFVPEGLVSGRRFLKRNTMSNDK
jgi:hypothetical protein